MSLNPKKEMVKNLNVGYANLLYAFLSGGRIPKDAQEAKAWFKKFEQFVQN